MTINDRFRIAREARKLSQRNVAEKISVGNTAISRIESGTNNPSDRTIRLFCDELGISEKWLRTGDGEMFAPTVEDELSVIAQRHGLDEMDVAIIRTYITLPKQAQDALKDFLIRLDIQRVAGNRMPDEWAAEIEAQEKNRSEQAGAEEQSP